MELIQVFSKDNNNEERFEELEDKIKGLEKDINKNSNKLDNFKNNISNILSQLRDSIQETQEKTEEEFESIRELQGGLNSKVNRLQEEELKQSDFNIKLKTFFKDYQKNYKSIKGKSDLKEILNKTMEPERKRIDNLETKTSQLSDKINSGLKDLKEDIRLDLFKEVYNLIIEKFSNISFKEVSQPERKKIIGQAMWLEDKSIEEIAKQLDVSQRQVYYYINDLKEDIKK